MPRLPVCSTVRVASVVILTIVAGYALAQPTGVRTLSCPETNGIQLCVDYPSKRQFSFGEPIEWTIRIRVSAPRPIRAAVEWFPIFSVVDGKGRAMRLTAHGNAREGMAEFVSARRPTMYYPMVPGDEFRTHLWLNRFYDVSELGVYSLRVQCKMPRVDDHVGVTIVSPPIEFEVVEPSEDFMDKLRSIGQEK